MNSSLLQPPEGAINLTFKMMPDGRWWCAVERNFRQGVRLSGDKNIVRGQTLAECAQKAIASVGARTEQVPLDAMQAAQIPVELMDAPGEQN